MTDKQDPITGAPGAHSTPNPGESKEIPPKGFRLPNGSDETTTTKQNRTNANISSSRESSQVERISLMILPAFIENGVRQLKVNIMLDPCSTGTYITLGAAEELHLQGDVQNLTISGTAGTEVKMDSRRVKFTVTSTNQRFSSTVEANVLDDITGSTPAIQWSDLKRNWSHLKSVPFENVANRRQVDVLIGSDHPIFHQVLREVPGKQVDEPIARLTKLGWVCFGPTQACSPHQTSRSHLSVRTYRTDSTAVETNSLLRKFWELEAIGIQDNGDQVWTPDEQAAVSRVEKTRVMMDGRYEVGIPWKENEPKFYNNYEMAYSRLENLEKSLRKKGDRVATEYDNIILDYIEKGYIRKVVPLNGEEQLFLPHFPVIREEKTTTKVRIVFDAAAMSNGKCLNDAILSGPKLQREITDVLLRFRRAPVALSADIAQMFLQVKLKEEDRPYHRFLWRNLNDDRPPDVYEFLRLPFGNTASPFCAQYVLYTHARSNASTYPEAADTVENSMYVDDVLDSTETTQAAIVLRRQLSQMLGGAGFALRE